MQTKNLVLRARLFTTESCKAYCVGDIYEAFLSFFLFLPFSATRGKHVFGIWALIFSMELLS